MTRRRAASARLGLLLVGLALPAGAEPHEAGRAARTPSLLTELGAAGAERLLESESPRERLRGLLRLSALGTPRAVELLVRALDPGGAARGAEEHLAAVRALAPHAALPSVREALVRALSSPPVEADAGPLSEWVQSAAALALAKTQDASALSALGRALRKPGHAAELSRDALLAFPPRDIAPVLNVPGAPTKELCQTLGELGDLRAESFLREVVRRGTPEARAAAALALQRFGVGEVVELARHWLRSERQPALVAAAVEILVREKAPDAAAALAQLARNEAQADSTFEYFLLGGGQVPLPAAVSLTSAGPRLPEVLELLARTGDGVSQLEASLARPETAGLALYSLSRAPGPRARERLERALAQPRLRALSLRALALRAVRLADVSPVLSRAAAGPPPEAPVERAAWAFARGVLNPESVPTLLGSRDAIVVAAAARLATSGAAALAAVERLPREPNPALQAALCAGLADAEATQRVPTAVLLRLTHAAGPGSLLAVRALAARKDAELLPLLRELLASGDPWLRAHTLLGLSRAEEADALGLIENAYRFESDASVRRAAVAALSRRAEPVKRRTLELAADLDASADVRAAARLALSGQTLSDSITGPETVWLELPRNAGLASGELAAAIVRGAGGLALPVLADPDGVVAVANLDPAPITVRLALLPQRVELAGASP